MFMNIGVILLVLFIAYLWTQQGLFSAFLHFVCTLVAGAIALAVWEPLVYGALLGFRQDLAWSLGLIGPFLISLVILRLASDKLIPGNLKFDEGTNFIGGGAFGFGAGVITAGMLLISVGFMRLPHDFAGYQPVRYDTNGNVVAGDTLWLPADTLTVRMYETLSRGGFTAGGSALAVRQPDLHRQAGLVRMTVRDKGEVALKPNAVEVLGTYALSGDILSDSFFLSPEGEPVRQQAAYFDGDRVGSNALLYGVALNFNAGAREGTGQVVLGPGQMRLIVRTPDGDVMGVQPMAVVSQAEGSSLELGRWRFDAPEVFVASTSTAAETRMAFEFAIPAGSEVEDLLVKNLRIPASKLPSPTQYPSTDARDEAIRNGAIVGLTLDGGSGTTTSGATQAPSGTTQTTSAGGGAVTIDGADNRAWAQAGVQINRTLPTGPMLKSKIRGGVSFNANDDGLTRANLVVNKQDVSSTGGPQNLRVDQFATIEGAAIVKVDISFRSPLTIAGRAVDQAMRFSVPILRDTAGEVYTPIGYYTEDGDRLELKFDPSQQLQMAELPTISRSAQQVQVVLIYAVTDGRSLREFAFGNETIATFSPPAAIQAR
jgi:hypothetical protein